MITRLDGAQVVPPNGILHRRRHLTYQFTNLDTVDFSHLEEPWQLADGVHIQGRPSPVECSSASNTAQR